MKVTLHVALGTKPNAEDNSQPKIKSYKGDPSGHQWSHCSVQPVRICHSWASRQPTAAADLTVQLEKAVRPADTTSACTCSFTGALEAEALKPCLTREVFVKKQKARLRWNEKSGLVWITETDPHIRHRGCDPRYCWKCKAVLLVKQREFVLVTALRLTRVPVI